ncbi:hypothetical protein KFL_009380030 [Klebsormidium nitens]|uniref:Uncharacterized protein n=1 Tax=Klebsormidium nitens TaxID=105231 RepID=A0A1Y1IN34_KLENI|nr:hypothetical protein KFL_009380030 [Klebsormidium nitens]|eukprot:GAQ92174.1 hypothetical protein KFL_009380030 [Klebsormidium nitens]
MADAALFTGIAAGKQVYIVDGRHSRGRSWSKAHYEGDVDTRRSTTGHVFLCTGGGQLVEQIAANGGASTVEAEYLSAAQAVTVKEALWFRKLEGDPELDLVRNNLSPDTTARQPRGNLRLLKHPIALQRSKHIDVIHHLARKEVAFAY